MKTIKHIHKPGDILLRLKSPYSFLMLTQVTCFKLSHLNDKDVTEFTVLPERRRQDKG